MHILDFLYVFYVKVSTYLSLNLSAYIGRLSNICISCRSAMQFQCTFELGFKILTRESKSCILFISDGFSIKHNLSSIPLNLCLVSSANKSHDDLIGKYMYLMIGKTVCQVRKCMQFIQFTISPCCTCRGPGYE